MPENCSAGRVPNLNLSGVSALLLATDQSWYDSDISGNAADDLGVSGQSIGVRKGKP